MASEHAIHDHLTKMGKDKSLSALSSDDTLHKLSEQQNIEEDDENLELF